MCMKHEEQHNIGERRILKRDSFVTPVIFIPHCSACFHAEKTNSKLNCSQNFNSICSCILCSHLREQELVLCNYLDCVFSSSIYLTEELRSATKK